MAADIGKSVGGSLGGSVGRALVRGALGGLAAAIGLQPRDAIPRWRRNLPPRHEETATPC